MARHLRLPLLVLAASAGLLLDAREWDSVREPIQASRGAATPEPARDAPASAAAVPEEIPLEPGPVPCGLVPREIVVLDAAGRAVPGLWIEPDLIIGWERREEAEARGRMTDGEGRALFYGPPGAGYPVVTGGVAPAEHVVLGDKPTVLRRKEGIRLEVELVDLRTGALVSEGARVAVLEPCTERSWPLETAGDRFVSAASPLCPGGGDRGTLSFAVDAPEGLAAWQAPAATVEGAVSRYAERLRVRIPLHREASIVMTVRNARGTPVAGAWAAEACIGWKGQTLGLGREWTGPDGVLRIRGIPDLAGETVRVVARARRWRTFPSEEFRLDGEGTLHEPVGREAEYDGPTPGNGCGSPDPCPGEPRPGNSALHILVVRRNGARAADAEVRLEGPPAEGDMAAWRVEGRTDGLGEATIAGLPAGPAFLEVREPGLVWTRVPVDLQAFAPAALRVDEPKGRTVRIRVRGDDGVSLAGASVRVRPDCGVAHAFVEDGVQVLGRFTDGTGECAVPGVPDGGARIWAEWGCRFETASVAPDTSEIEVVLSRRD